MIFCKNEWLDSKGYMTKPFPLNLLWREHAQRLTNHPNPKQLYTISWPGRAMSSPPRRRPRWETTSSRITRRFLFGKKRNKSYDTIRRYQHNHYQRRETVRILCFNRDEEDPTENHDIFLLASTFQPNLSTVSSASGAALGPFPGLSW